MEQEIKRNIPRDLFLHLLAIVTLYWSSISFITLLWQFINYLLPEVPAQQYALNYSLDLIRFSVSALFIVFPVFIFVSWYLNRIYRREAVVRESKIRKWLIYLTLFIASLVVVVDLVTVIQNLLGGETTIKFVLKAITVLLVSGFVFGYYLDDVRRETPTKLAKYFAWITGVLVSIGIVSSFFIIGSPATAGLIKIDQRKISDLQGIQSQIVYYWQRKEVLPNSLEELKDPISNYIVPVDPQNKNAYEYIVKDKTNLSFQICAEFNREGSDQYGEVRPMSNITKGIENWEHPAGRYCFERTIDKELYPPLNKIK